MSGPARASRLAVLLALACGALAACQALAGIEDRKYDPSANTGEAGATGSGASAQCQKYCALAKEVCQGNDTLYTIDDDDAACLATCALMQPGVVGEPALGNTVECRINQLQTARQPETEPQEIPAYCAKASAGGNGTCGTNCESYCQLFAAACPQTVFPLPQISAQYDPKQCLADCAGLADTGRFDRVANYNGDTVQCRLVHISAAVSLPNGLQDHCPHAQLQAQTHAAMPCIDVPTAMLTDADCDAFCTLEMAECSRYPAYQSQAQCLAVCKALPKGTFGDQQENTVGCRKYHSYNAMGDDVAGVSAAQYHCTHTGPGGDGHCGSGDAPSPTTTTGNCESYCLLLQAACDSAATPGLDPADTFKGTFANQNACTQACGRDLMGAGKDQGYTVDPEPTGNNLQCRLLQVSKALTALAAGTSPLSECAAALGGMPCK